MTFDDRCDDRQAEPGAWTLGRACAPPEALEQPIALLRGRPRALVADREQGAAVACSQSDRHSTRFGTVDEAVLDQVLQHAPQRSGLAADLNRVGVLERHPSIATVFADNFAHE